MSAYDLSKVAKIRRAAEQMHRRVAPHKQQYTRSLVYIDMLSTENERLREQNAELAKTLDDNLELLRNVQETGLTEDAEIAIAQQADENFYLLKKNEK